MSDEAGNDIVDFSAIQTLFADVHLDGKNVVMSEEASKRIADFKRAQKLLSEVEDMLKEQVRDALAPFNATSLRGRYATISVGKPRKPASKYKIAADTPNADLYKTEKISLVPDETKIDAYFEANKHLPAGITAAEQG